MTTSRVCSTRRNRVHNPSDGVAVRELLPRSAMSTPFERPAVLVLAGLPDSLFIEAMFAHRGFAVIVTPSLTALRSYFARGGETPSVAIVDFARDDAPEAAAELGERDARPPVIGILEPDAHPPEPEGLEAAFVRPVDPARLFVRVVELLAAQRGGRRKRMLTGLVGAVEGNDLFDAIAAELAAVVSVVNAGAVLEATLREIDVGPFVVKPADVVAVLATGSLEEALLRFAEEDAVALALRRVFGLAMARSKRRSPDATAGARSARAVPAPTRRARAEPR
jgi:hypothetical protein